MKTSDPVQRYLKSDCLSRRHFVERLSKSLLGVSVAGGTGSWLSGGLHAQVVSKPKATADHCVLLMMTGGMSHLDTFDPKPDKNEIMGKTATLKSAIGGELFADNIPRLAKIADHLAVVRSMYQKTADHRQATYTTRTSYSMRPTIIHPSMGAWAQRLLGKKNELMPDSVTVNAGVSHPGQGFLPPTFSPMPVGDPNAGVPNMTPFGVDYDSPQKKAAADEALARRLSLTEKLDASFREQVKHEKVQAYTQFYDETLKFLRSDDLKLFDLGEESEAVRDRYGRNSFGQGCLLAKRLVAGGTRFVEVTQGGWDTHVDNFETVPDLSARLDQGAANLITDLAADGLLERTMVVIATEFGRTPVINANAGRDHHSLAFSCAFAGGGVNGGQVIGSTDETGTHSTSDPYEPKQLNATIATALGIDLDEVVHSASGRPFTVATHQGRGDDIVTSGVPIPGVLG